MIRLLRVLFGNILSGFGIGRKKSDRDIDKITLPKNIKKENFQKESQNLQGATDSQIKKEKKKEISIKEFGRNFTFELYQSF